MYASIKGIGESVCLIQFPDTDDVVVTEYVVTTRKACRYGVLGKSIH